MVPGYPLYIDEISYWIPDVEEIRYEMAVGLDVVFDERMRQRAEKDASEYKDSIPDTAVEVPEGAENIGRANRRDLRYNDYSESTRLNDSTRDDTNQRDTYSRADDYERDEVTPRSESRHEDFVPRTYDERNYTEDRTDSDTRVYDRDTDSRRLNQREKEVDVPFEDVPGRGDSDKTRN